MKKFLFHGYYGFKNTGDDAFIEVASWGAKRYWNSDNSVFQTSSLPKIETQAKHLSAPLFRGADRLQVLWELRNATCFVSAGGSTFPLVQGFSMKNISLKGKIYNRNLKIGAIGVSIGPFKNVEDEQSVASYLKKIDFLATRDQRSYDYVKTLDLPYNPVDAFDLAALLPSIYNYEKNPQNSKQKIVGVSVCNYEQYKNGNLFNETRRNNYLIELLQKLPDDPNITYRFFYFNGNELNGDVIITNYIISQIPNKNIEVIPYLADVKKTWMLLAECSLVLSTRLHASIFACYAEVPFFLVEYHRKCTDFLDDVGQNQKYYIGDGDCDLTQIVNEMNLILYDNVYTPPSKIDETQIKALSNFTQTLNVSGGV